MATDNMYTLTAAAAAAGLIRVGDNQCAQVATGMVSPDGTKARFLTNNGNTVGASGVAESVTTLTDGATVTWDWAAAPNAQVTLGGNRTLAITNAYPGMTAWLKITQDATGSRTLTTAGWLKPALTTTGAGVDEFHVKCVDTNTYFGAMAKTCV